jgi:hypothetical protein
MAQIKTAGLLHSLLKEIQECSAASGQCGESAVFSARLEHFPEKACPRQPSRACPTWSSKRRLSSRAFSSRQQAPNPARLRSSRCYGGECKVLLKVTACAGSREPRPQLEALHQRRPPPARGSSCLRCLGLRQIAWTGPKAPVGLESAARFGAQARSGLGRLAGRAPAAPARSPPRRRARSGRGRRDDRSALRVSCAARLTDRPYRGTQRPNRCSRRADSKYCLGRQAPARLQSAPPPRSDVPPTSSCRERGCSDLQSPALFRRPPSQPAILQSTRNAPPGAAGGTGTNNRTPGERPAPTARANW